MADTQDQLSFGKYRTFINAMQKVANQGSAKMVELPMLIGGMMPLSGRRAPNGTLHDRKLVQVKKQDFDTFMGQVAPEVEVEVPDASKPGGKRMVKLRLTQMKDFDPGRIAELVPELNELIQIRRRLKQLAANLGAKPATERQLAEVLAETKPQLPETR